MTTKYQLIFSSPPGGAIDPTGAFKDSVVSPATVQYVATSTISAASLIGMNTIPVLVLPAVAGKTLIVMKAALVTTAGSVLFTGGGGIHLQYAAASGGPVASSDMSADTLTGAGNRLGQAGPATGVSSVTQSGIALYLTNATTPFAAGNGTAVLHIWYQAQTM